MPVHIIRGSARCNQGQLRLFNHACVARSAGSRRGKRSHSRGTIGGFRSGVSGLLGGICERSSHLYNDIYFNGDVSEPIGQPSQMWHFLLCEKWRRAV